MKDRYYLRSNHGVEGHAEVDVTRREGLQSNPDLANTRASVDRSLVFIENNRPNWLWSSVTRP